jgi:uncharacterized protein with PQ loop repeat
VDLERLYHSLQGLNHVFGTIGMICAFVITAVGLPRQIMINYLRKSTEGISLVVIVFAFGSYTSFTLYGLSRPSVDWFLVIGYSMGSVFGLLLLAQTWWYRQSPRPVQRPREGG